MSGLLARQIDSDGKSNSGVRTIFLDAFTVELRRRDASTMLDERAVFGPDYEAHAAG